MKKNLLKIASIVLAGSIALTACNKKEDDPKPSGAYSNATFVVCEGNFGQNDGSIDAIIDGELKKDIFQAENNRPLGDIVQSMTIIGDQAFIVVNNSGKIEVVNKNTFKSEGTCTGLSYPRYVVNRNDNEIFVSNGNGTSGDDYVYVVNKLSMQKTDSVATGFGPNTMVVLNGKLFVANSGGYSTDKSVTVIDINTFKVEKTIEIGDVPSDMDLDSDGNIIVYCKGNWGENSSIVKLNTTSYATTTIKAFDHQLGSFGTNLVASNDKIYFIDGVIDENYIPVDGGVYVLNNDSEEKVFEGTFYGVSINPANGDIWATNSTSNSVSQYDKTGKLIKTYKVSASYPNAVIF